MEGYAPLLVVRLDQSMNAAVRSSISAVFVSVAPG
jgi:hypothetical protein